MSARMKRAKETWYKEYLAAEQRAARAELERDKYRAEAQLLTEERDQALYEIERLQRKVEAS